MIDRLEKFKKIAWDFDGTLIDHPKSELMQEFIIDHPEIDHYIVTFRTHGMENEIFYDLSFYPNPPDKSDFKKVFNISRNAWKSFDRDNKKRLYRYISGPPTLSENYYITWKGMICALHQIPVLIDDRPELVIPGCKEYGIEYIHPDEL